MGSAFDAMVRARREHTPWAHISLTALMKELAEEGDKGVTLTCTYDFKQVTRCWWTLTWTDEDGHQHSVGSQQYDLCLWRAAETVMQQREKAKQEEKARQMHSQYHDGDIVGYWIQQPQPTGIEPKQRVICADCWDKTSDEENWHTALEVTFEDTGYYELVCSTCHLQLPTRGEP